LCNGVKVLLRFTLQEEYESPGFHLSLVVIALFIWKLIFFLSSFLMKNWQRTFLWLEFMLFCFWAVDIAPANWSAPSVREDISALSFYFVFSIGRIAISQVALAFAGISVRDDVAERGNNAAGFAASGFTAGATCCVSGANIGDGSATCCVSGANIGDGSATCCVSGANIGDGPGFEVVLFCAALATGALLIWHT
jgi:hypothetical protein